MGSAAESELLPLYQSFSVTACHVETRDHFPQGSLIQEAGSFLRHPPSSLPTTFTFLCRDVVWNNNDTRTTSHAIIGAVILDLHHILPLLPWGHHWFHLRWSLKCQFGPELNWYHPDRKSYLKPHRLSRVVKGLMMLIRSICHSAMRFVF